ncbi:hypothetical protein GOP47_0000384 [Adiantum capillus-veneris]|uniref:Uncharacterized protein n=1 Tax=Adiantum capillus-veneris TaxID=13818 RepID=A0A9D4VDU9_ADICA|nr:hypothetical protein GOP47_0000384 [Adiantum capillus-veneris]
MDFEMADLSFEHVQSVQDAQAAHGESSHELVEGNLKEEGVLEAPTHEAFGERVLSPLKKLSPRASLKKLSPSKAIRKALNHVRASVGS